MDNIIMKNSRLLLNIFRALTVMSMFCILMILLSSALLLIQFDQIIEIMASYYSMLPYLMVMLILFATASIGTAILSMSRSMNLSKD